MQYRTFRTKLEFIKSIFSEKYDQDEIITSGIQHKLDVSLFNYEYLLTTSVDTLLTKKSLKILKRLDKEFDE